MSSTGKLFISTVPAKQMARELEISAGMINELNRLLYEERARNEALAAELYAAKATVRTQRRKRQRKAAKLRSRVAELEGVVEGEKQRAEEAYDNYLNCYRAWEYQKEECDVLTARCEEREKEIAEMRARARSEVDLVPFTPDADVARRLRYLGYPKSFVTCTYYDFEWKTMLSKKLIFHTRLLGRLPTPGEAMREEDYIRGASADELRILMNAVAPGELLPVRACLNPEEEDEAVDRDRELNYIRQNNPVQMTHDTELMREFLLRWRWHHKRLPGGHTVPEMEWGGECD
jgi:hypothetical protein